MGMDVYGRNPANDNGRNFSARIDEWYPLQALMIAAGWVEAVAWGTNDGLGLPTQAVCDRLVDTLEVHLLCNTKGNYLFPLLQARRRLEVALSGQDEASCRVDIDTVRLFISFLRSCGGFKIR